MAKKKQEQDAYPDALEPVEVKDYANVSPIEPLGEAEQGESFEPRFHKLGSDTICGTDERGFAAPMNRSPFEIVVDASEGFIPLWEPNRVLKWQFNENSMRYFRYPSLAKGYIKQLFAEAISAWGDSAPIRFSQNSSGWDFEIYMSSTDNCSPNGCTLAAAFFPDGGRHRLRLYPKMFQQSRKEQVDTFIHEIGHIFGLRHFFANVSETAWPSVIFGEHKAFSIMNYGALSELTTQDKSDLKALYSGVWGGSISSINGTPIVLFKPYHYAIHWWWPSLITQGGVA